MKTLLAVSLIITFIYSNSAIGCEVCGCGAGATYFGLQPNLARNFVGIRWRTMDFDSHLGMGERFRTQEIFHTAELLARWYPLDRLQALISVPYSANTQYTRTGNINLNGIGDIALVANYNIVERDNTCAPDEVSHAFTMGGGLTLPTGRHELPETDNNDEVNNPNFQIGTGSVSFLALAQYIVRLGNYGISVDAQGKIHTVNADNYRFGNRVSSTLTMFVIIDNDDWKIMPSLGVYGEYSGYNDSNGTPINVTGGYLTNGIIGTDIFLNSFMVGLHYQIPIVQKLGNNYLQSNQRFMTTFAFMF